jgi:hypothetical protein
VLISLIHPSNDARPMFADKCSSWIDHTCSVFSCFVSMFSWAIEAWCARVECRSLKRKLKWRRRGWAVLSQCMPGHTWLSPFNYLWGLAPLKKQY